ncbi:hypothetical protein Pcinc_005021, partial [Petrolisthes cinctipes]
MNSNGVEPVVVVLVSKYGIKVEAAGER